MCSCPQLKPFGAKDEDRDIDYGQELGVGLDGMTATNERPLKVTIDAVSVQPAIPAEGTPFLCDEMVILRLVIFFFHSCSFQVDKVGSSS